jgi:DNA repair protein RadC
MKPRKSDRWSMRVDVPMVRESETGKHVSRTPADVANLCAEIKDAGQELFVVLDMNGKNGIIDKRLVTMGLLDASLVHPREVFRGAIVNMAKSIVCVHNHPSGDPTPSAEDIRITSQLVEAGRVLGICVLDHVIIGRNDDGSLQHLSLREQGIVSFGK